MRSLVKFAAAVVLGLTTLGGAAAFADDDDDRGDRDRDRYDDRFDDGRGDYRDANYRGGRPDRCDEDHDHRYHQRNYYDYYPKDRYYRADPGFSISVSVGDRGNYGRGGRYNDRPYYDQRGYRDAGRIVSRDRYPIRGFRADAFVIEEVYGGGRGYGRLVCTVTARGPDARYVPYGQLRRIANSACSRRSEIRVLA